MLRIGWADSEDDKFDYITLVATLIWSVLIRRTSHIKFIWMFREDTGQSLGHPQLILYSAFHICQNEQQAGPLSILNFNLTLLNFNFILFNSWDTAHKAWNAIESTGSLSSLI